MHIYTYFYLLASLQAAQALTFPTSLASLNVPSLSAVKRGLAGLFSRQAQCPAVWTEIHAELAQAYVTNGQCNDDARAVIRLAFHDCFSGGKCDGSIVLTEECGRAENRGLPDICGKISSMAQAKGVGVADLIQMAAATAIVACPLGPRVPVFVGRQDSSVAAPAGDLPGHTESADQLLSRFAAKGFNAQELVALVGAHSTAKQFFVDQAKSGAALDSTPGVWDTAFYGNTLTGTAPFILESDKNLAFDSRTMNTFAVFSVSQQGWAAAFVSAMSKVSLMGVPGGSASLIDCSSVLTGGTVPRDVKAADINGRAT